MDTFARAWTAESETKRGEAARRAPSVAVEATDPPERLMELFLDGDALAFERLFKQLAPRVASTLGRMSGDARLAEDLTQVVFLKLYRARAAYLRGTPLAPWVFAIARNVFLDERRKRRRRRETLSADGQLPELPVEAPAGSDEWARRNLEAALGNLPPKQREALVLLKMQGLSLAEVAAFAGTSVGSIKMRLQRAYHNLRVHLREPSASDVEQGRTRR